VTACRCIFRICVNFLAATKGDFHPANKGPFAGTPVEEKAT
jgi:hypothetical protein